MVIRHRPGDRFPRGSGSTPDEIIDAFLAKRARDREEFKRKQLKKVGRKVRPVPKGVR